MKKDKSKKDYVKTGRLPFRSIESRALHVSKLERTSELAGDPVPKGGSFQT